MDDEDPIMDAVRTFNAKNPDKMAIALNPGDATIDAFFERQLRKHPYQKVAYETDFVGPYTRDQWPEQRAFLERCFRMGMFNMLTYSASKGGGGFFQVKDIDALYGILEGIDDTFKRFHTSTLKYGLQMNVGIQGCTQPKDTLTLTNNLDEIMKLKQE